MTYADKLSQQGVEQGRQQGAQQGKRDVLLRLLQQKFGPLRADVQAHIDASNGTQVEAYLDRVLTADSLDAVLGR